MEPSTHETPDMAQDCPTEAAFVHFPHDDSSPNASAGILQFPLWHSAPSLHAAPEAREPVKLHALISSRLAVQPAVMMADAHAPKAESVTPLPGKASTFVQIVSKIPWRRVLSLWGGKGPPVHPDR
jgi:hypothetical protein